MTEERAALITIPTEMERSDAFFYLAMPIGLALLGWYMSQFGIPLYWLAPPIGIVGLWMLTGEPVTDVAVIGAVATWLRGQLGLRQAHEWLAAWWHYFTIRTWPDWKVQCSAFLKFSQQRIMRWRVQFSAWTISRASAGHLWGSRIRSSSSDALEP